jgi:hypothetical protein
MLGVVAPGEWSCCTRVTTAFAAGSATPATSRAEGSTFAVRPPLHRQLQLPHRREGQPARRRRGHRRRHPAPLRCPERRRGRCLRRGAVAIGSCVVVDIRGCVALSPALFDLKLGDRLTANIAIARARAPLLVADAPDDSDSPITEVQTLLRRARPGVVLFVRLPAAAGHGWDTVNDRDDPHRR